MRVLTTLLWLALFLVLLVFSIANTDIATVRLFGQSFSAPLVLLLLMFFAAGAVAGMLAALPSWFRGRREIARLARELAERTGGGAPAPEVAAGARPGAFATRAAAPGAASMNATQAALPASAVSAVVAPADAAAAIEPPRR